MSRVYSIGVVHRRSAERQWYRASRPMNESSFSLSTLIRERRVTFQQAGQICLEFKDYILTIVEGQELLGEVGTIVSLRKG